MTLCSPTKNPHSPISYLHDPVVLIYLSHKMFKTENANQNLKFNQMSDSNKLYRSNTDKVIGGVAGGLADYFNMDPVVIRILFVLLAIFGGGGVLIYIVLWIAIPKQPLAIPGMETTEVIVEDKDPGSRKKNTSLIAGVLLIFFGLLILIDRITPFYDLFSNLWPLLLVFAGLLLLVPEFFKPSKNIKS